MNKQQVLEQASMRVFDELESEVRSYCRSFQTVFAKAKDYRLWDKAGNEYIDFFAGAGALNYGHNNPRLKSRLLDYIAMDGVTHSLDMATEAKEKFLLRFNEVILQPRKLKYKVMFPGPTGTNAVESAIKIARKVTGRQTIMSFTNAFHGMTLGSLSLTGNKFKRAGAGVPLHNNVFMPYDGYFGEETDTVEYIEKLLQDDGSGVDVPAAIILETVQGEGGLQVARFEWLKQIEELCRRREILLIVDDIQMGSGRTGTFFSFEPAGIKPDIVCLSKSIGGYGLPMALTLIRPELDIWAPGEHNGTFRGNNLAFVAAAEALSYWENDCFSREIQAKSLKIRKRLEKLVGKFSAKGEIKGRGMIQGIAFEDAELADKISAAAFQRGLIMETSGAKSECIKIMPPLIIDEAGLDRGMDILEKAIEAVVKGGVAV